VKIIADKRKAEQRAIFTFYQTRYLRQKRRFAILPLSLL
jgi:hypothetical protein